MATEVSIRTLLATKTSRDFYPATAQWIHCRNFTYRPHSNECGPRSLLAATILALHPAPYSNILLPWMHNNLAQIARTWIGGQIMQTPFDTAAISSFLCPHQQCTSFQITSAVSMPADLIEWRLHLDTNIEPIKSTIHKQPTSVKLHSNVSLNPLAPIFQPKSSRPIGEHTPPQSYLYASKQHTRVKTQGKCNTRNTTASLPVKKGLQGECNSRITTASLPVKKDLVQKGPSKRTSFLLPRQNLLTKYLPLKNPKPASPLSLSEPTQVSEHSSQSTTLSSEIKPKNERLKPKKPTIPDELPKPKCTQKA
jgi:hypothetical protein